MQVTPEFSSRLQRQIDDFHDRIRTDPVGVIDPHGFHHAFSQTPPLHGQKVDFDKILSGTEFFIEWAALTTRAIIEMCEGNMPDAFVGIANGTNRLAEYVAHSTEKTFLETTKVGRNSVVLTDKAIALIANRGIRSAMTTEDTGTTGSTVSSAVAHLRLQQGIEVVEAQTSYQRSENLTVLDELEVNHWAMIHAPLPNYTAEECQTLPEGFCARGFQLIPHGS